MLQAYQGYFFKGRFISNDNIAIPENKKVIVTVLDDEFDNINANDLNSQSISEQQFLAFEEYFKAVDKIDDEDFTDDDFSELENNRLNFGRELR